MKNSVVVGCGLLLTAALVGCGDSGPDAVLQKQLRLLTEMAAVMEKVQDKEAYDEALATMKLMKKRGRDLENELEKEVKALSQEQVNAAVKKYKSRREEASMKFFEAEKQARLRAGLPDPQVPPLP